MNNRQRFLNYKDGWFDGEGTAYKPDEVNWCFDFMEKKLHKTLRKPGIFPMLEGGIQIEWFDYDFCPTLEFNLTLKKAELHYLFDNEEGCIVENFNLTSDTDIYKLNEKLMSLLKTTY